jgi:hypothetical protein
MIPNEDFLTEKKVEKKSNYEEYHKLSIYQKKCLHATNYWRVILGLGYIEVPEEDADFHNYFDKRCFEIAKKRL